MKTFKQFLMEDAPDAPYETPANFNRDPKDIRRREGDMPLGEDKEPKPPHKPMHNVLIKHGFSGARDNKHFKDHHEYMHKEKPIKAWIGSDGGWEVRSIGSGKPSKISKDPKELKPHLKSLGLQEDLNSQGDDIVDINPSKRTADQLPFTR